MSGRRLPPPDTGRLLPSLSLEGWGGRCPPLAIVREVGPRASHGLCEPQAPTVRMPTAPLSGLGVAGSHCPRGGQPGTSQRPQLPLRPPKRLAPSLAGLHPHRDPRRSRLRVHVHRGEGLDRSCLRRLGEQQVGDTVGRPGLEPLLASTARGQHKGGAGTEQGSDVARETGEAQPPTRRWGGSHRGQRPGRLRIHHLLRTFLFTPNRDPVPTAGPQSPPPPL